jgi:membrane protease YdiL (CAAX protease family)
MDPDSVNPEEIKQSRERLQPAHGFMLFGGVIFLSIFVSLAGGDFILKLFEDGNISVLILISHTPLLLMGIVFMLATGMRFSDLHLSWPKGIDFAWALLLSLVAFFGASVILLGLILFYTFVSPGFLSESLEMINEFNKFITPVTLSELLVGLVFLAFIPAVVEEFIYRGLMMESFKKWGPVWAVVLSGLAFGISHEMPLRIPSLIFVGFLLGWFRLYSRNLGATMLTHFIYNSFVVTLSMVTSEWL